MEFTLYNIARGTPTDLQFMFI